MGAADSDHQRSNLADEHRLKYLDFVLVAAIHAVMFAAKLYNYAKEHSGPLRAGVNTVENSVRSIVGPVSVKFHHVPAEVLKFVDRTIDESVNKVQNRVPRSLKRASSNTLENAKKAPMAARSVMSQVKNNGMVETASGLAKTAYAKYEPVAKDLTEQYVMYIWHLLNQYALFQRAVQTMGPIANYYSEVYNEKVQDAAEKGYKVASHLPLVPTKKIAKVLSNGNLDSIHGEAAAAAVSS